MSTSLSAPQRNPVSQRQHRRDVAWQIVFPLVLGVIGALALVFLAISAEAGITQWASIALIWLALPLIFLGLLCLAFLVMVVLAVNWLLRRLPHYSFRALRLTRRVHQRVSQWDDRLVEPWMRYQMLKARLAGIVRRQGNEYRQQRRLSD